MRCMPISEPLRQRFLQLLRGAQQRLELVGELLVKSASVPMMWSGYMAELQRARAERQATTAGHGEGAAAAAAQMAGGSTGPAAAGAAHALDATPAVGAAPVADAATVAARHGRDVVGGSAATAASIAAATAAALGGSRTNVGSAAHKSPAAVPEPRSAGQEVPLLPGQWACPACTFANEQSADACAICETLKPEDAEGTPLRHASRASARLCARMASRARRDRVVFDGRRWQAAAPRARAPQSAARGGERPAAQVRGRALRCAARHAPLAALTLR